MSTPNKSMLSASLSEQLELISKQSQWTNDNL